MAHSTNQIEVIFSTLCNHVYNNRLADALSQLSLLKEGIHDADFTLQFEDINQTYRMLLEYNFKGVVDPQRDSIYNKLKVSLVELADKVRQHALSATGMHTYYLKSQLDKEKETAKEEAAVKIDSYSFELEFSKLLNETDLSSSDSLNDNSLSVSPKLFKLMWLTDKYTESDFKLVKAIRESESLPWYEKCVAVSAVTLSLINCFDKEKFNLLCDFYADKQPQVWQRALTGIVFALFIYDKRLAMYPVIESKLEQLANDEVYVSDISVLLLQVFKSLETEKITRKFRDEILPDVQKFESKIRQKLDIDNLINDELIQDKNPDWEQIFEDSPDLLNKIEKMSEMQMDGLDLFMGTFAMLKNFDFFREISNWFRPFYQHNEVASGAIDNNVPGKDMFLNGLENSFYMCNSDKYSFCLNIKNLPDDQGRNMIGLFNMEASTLSELVKEDNLLNKPGRDAYIFTQYIQDLYRFYKLHPFRADFRDVFSLQWDLPANSYIRSLKGNSELLRKTAEFLFNKQHYTIAGNIFNLLADKSEPDQAVYEKLGYCFQMSGNYPKAVEYYKRAELFDVNRIWSLKKIIFCYRKSGNTTEALKWSLEAFSIEPENTYINLMLANCYLDLQMHDKALEHYFKVEILDPENKKVLRPIAWCSFVLGKLDLASDYVSQILVDEPVANDYINAGHIELCKNNKLRAMENYKMAFRTGNFSLRQFEETLEFDKQVLLSNGVPDSELPLLTDYLKYHFLE